MMPLNPSTLLFGPFSGAKQKAKYTSVACVFLPKGATINIMDQINCLTKTTFSFAKSVFTSSVFLKKTLRPLRARAVLTELLPHNAQGHGAHKPLKWVKAKAAVMPKGLHNGTHHMGQNPCQILNNQIKTTFSKYFHSPIKKRTHTWHASLKPSSSITGFKKALYNRVKVRNAQLDPTYNRRKHNHGHYNLITNQIKRLSKTFGYVNGNKINAWIGLALTAFKQNPMTFSNAKKQCFAIAKTGQQHVKLCARTVPSLVTLIESESPITLWKNSYYASLNATKQALRHKRCDAQYKLLTNSNLHHVSPKKGHTGWNSAWLKAGEVFRQL